jgi:hypothetical protein
MARGDVKVFAAWELTSKAGSFNLASGGDTIKMGIVTNTTVPTVGTADPRWGSGGSTDFSTNQVTTGTSYSSGGPTLTSQTYTRSSGIDTFDCDDITIAQDASGFTNGYYGIFYDSTDSGKHAIAFVDLGGPVSIQGGPLVLTINASGLFTETAS